jgi:hypothetical protein
MTAQPSFFDSLGRDLVEKRRRLVRRRRARRIAGAAVAVVALTGAAIAFTLDRDGHDRTVVAEPAAPVLPPSEWSWRRLTNFPPPDIGESFVVQWLGSKLFVWSTEGAFVHDPDDGATSAAPPAPVDFSHRRSVWTGSEVVMVGRGTNLPQSAEAVAFDPVANRWRLLPTAPLEWTAPLVTVWTGREVIFWGDWQSNRPAVSERGGAAYNPETNTWRRLADAPVALNAASGVWTGTELIVIGSDLDGNNMARTPTQMLRYDPLADEWAIGPPPPVSPNSSHAVWNGELVVWDYLLAAVRFDREANEWRPLPPAPLDDVECYVDGTTVGSIAVMAYCGQYAALDLRTETWTVIRDPGESGAAVVAPDHILHFGPSGNELLVIR